MMMKLSVLFASTRVRGCILAVAGLVLISGCSSSMSRVQTWEGSAENVDQIAVLSTPGAINVRKVNEQAMSDFLIEDLKVDYELLPGENRIVFTHKTIWSKAERVEGGESKVHVVETPLQVLTIDAEPGETYSFRIDKPETRQQAEAFARDFSADLVSSGGQVVATSSPWVASDSRKAVARAPVPDSSPADATGNDAGKTTIEQLKSLWGEASEDEKREFLRWAFE